MITKDIPLNHDILLWARTQANLSPDQAANKAHLKDLKARGKKETLPSAIRIQRWEDGSETPTLNQLEKLALAYRRPLLTFFLPDPPIQQTKLQDFRTVANKKFDSEAFSPEFSALLRQIEALQLNIHDLLAITGTERFNFISTLNMSLTPVEAADKIRANLAYSFDTQRKTRGSDRLFSDIRIKAEGKGIFVLLEGNLGSYHTDIEPEVFRGLSISDSLAPFIVINPNDAKTAMIFTLIHELCHLGLGETGISNWNSLDISKKAPVLKNETFCDQVAAEFLVPRYALLAEWEKFTIGYSPEETIQRISKQFNVSRIVIARRLLDFEQITRDFYWEYFKACQDEWEKRNSTKKKTKVPYKIRIKSRLGNKLISTVIGAAAQGNISELEASRMLNVKINHFSQIL